MVIVPGPPVRPAGMGAVSCVALTKVVGSDAPFHCTCAPCGKPVPFTVRVKDGPPCMTETGLRVVMTGGAVMENLLAAEVWPPLLTVTLMLAGLAIIVVEM